MSADKNILGNILRHNDDQLQHFGVKGMRWGVRRAVGKVTGTGKKTTPNEGGKKLKQLESQMKNTKDPVKRKSLQKKYGEMEDSIDYSKPKSGAKTARQLKRERDDIFTKELAKAQPKGSKISDKDAIAKAQNSKAYKDADSKVKANRAANPTVVDKAVSGVKKKYNDRKTHGSEIKDIVRRRKSGEITRKQAKQERWNSLHKLQSNNKAYKKTYDKLIAKGVDPNMAVRRAYARTKKKKITRTAVLRAATVPLSVVAIQKGKQFLK